MNFHLEQYDGPLDLLLDLIRKQEINIYDIPIARITQQYLEYMQKAAETSMELSAEFVYMAATLIHIKSKMLLPRDPELAKLDPEEDPRKELVDRLLEHERFKTAAEMLHQKRVVEEAVWSNPQIAQFRSESDDPGLAVTLFDLVKTLQNVLERAKQRPTYEINSDEVSVPDMVRFLRATFGRERGTISARELFERQRSRRAMVCLFLAMLELVKIQALGLTQTELFGEIGLKKLKGFEAAFAEDQVMPAIEEGYN
ncbi:MAG: segregation/condensation protein A [Acidobacteriota bacterium]